VEREQKASSMTRKVSKKHPTWRGKWAESIHHDVEKKRNSTRTTWEMKFCKSQRLVHCLTCYGIKVDALCCPKVSERCQTTRCHCLRTAVNADTSCFRHNVLCNTLISRPHSCAVVAAPIPTSLRKAASVVNRTEMESQASGCDIGFLLKSLFPFA
jgi:hypothetical protein